MIDRVGILLHELLVQRVFVVSTFFCGLDEVGFHEDFDVVANGRLGEIDDILDIGTGSASSLFRDMLKYPQAVCIAQGLGNLLNLFQAQCHGKSIEFRKYIRLKPIREAKKKSFCIIKQLPLHGGRNEALNRASGKLKLVSVSIHHL